MPNLFLKTQQDDDANNPPFDPGINDSINPESMKKIPPIFFDFFSDGKCGSKIQEIDSVKGWDMPRTNAIPNSNILQIQISESNYSEKCRNQKM